MKTSFRFDGLQFGGKRVDLIVENRGVSLLSRIVPGHDIVEQIPHYLVWWRLRFQNIRGSMCPEDFVAEPVCNLLNAPSRSVVMGYLLGASLAKVALDRSTIERAVAMFADADDEFSIEIKAA